MAELVEVLFPAPVERRDPLAVIGWWERRRPLYNAVVGATGLVTLAGYLLVNLLPPHAPGLIPFFPLAMITAVYGVMANVCYTAGSVVEITAYRLWKRGVLPVGPALFRHMLVFSVGLTLFPLLLSVLVWVARVVAAVIGVI